MLVSLNLLCKWLIQLSPFTAVTGISLFPTAWPANGESSARIAIKAFIDVIDENMIDQLFILPFEGAEASAPSLHTPISSFAQSEVRLGVT